MSEAQPSAPNGPDAAVAASGRQVTVEDGATRAGSGHAAGIFAGIIAGANVTGIAVAKASLLFVGPLAPGLPMAVTSALIGSAILAAFLAWRSAVPGTVAGVQDVPAAVLTAAVAVITVGMAGDPERAVATAFALIIGASLLSGVALYLTGRLRLGRVVKLFPHPVIAGFLASTGWVLLSGGLMMVLPGGHGMPGSMGEALPAVLAFATGAALTVATRVVPHSAMTILVLLIAAVAFYLGVAMLPGLTIESARASGLMAPVAVADGTALLDPRLALGADWGEVIGALPAVGVVALLCIFATLLNVGALEAATGEAFDADRELRATGIANVLLAPVGSPPGYAYVSMTSFTHRVGGGGRIAGYVNAATLVAGILIAGQMLAWVPPFLFAGLVVSLGLDFLWSWIVEARRRVTTAEWAIVVAITAVAATVGFLSAIGFGLALSAALFVWDYARTSPIRHVATLAEERSTRERPPAEDATLQREGGRVEIVLLQGYLFFGSAERVLTRLRSRLADADRPSLSRLILDFRHVTGIDTASVAVLRRVGLLAAQHGAEITLTRADERVAAAIARAGEGAIGPSDQGLDTVLAETEADLIATFGPSDAAEGCTAAIDPAIADVAEPVRFASGERMMQAGDEADYILFLQRGSAEVTAPGGGTEARLRILGPGSAIGDMAPYLGARRTADVVALEPVAALRLTTEALDRLETADPARAARIHRALARGLSEKVAAANALVRRASL